MTGKSEKRKKSMYIPGVSLRLAKIMKTSMRISEVLVKLIEYVLYSIFLIIPFCLIVKNV